jgi:oligopeptide transport system ATP-binding protein
VALLEVRHLDTRFDTPEGEVKAVNDVSFMLDEGDVVGIVGESGAGKSQLFLTIMGLLAANGRASGSARFRGTELLGLRQADLNRIRGSRIAMIFQDALTSLNPYLRISRQMTEVLVTHRGMGERDARRAAIEMLDRVRIPEARQRFDMYPHEFSGGMRQRVMIAMALLCRPDLLIADEPTTALDVTIQAQILDLLRDIRRDGNMAIVLITHALGVVAGLCDRVLVMYGGRIVEEAPVRDIFYDPQHPYTRALLGSTPRLDAAIGELRAIPGQPPNLQRLPPGCAFNPRCERAMARCLVEEPALREIGAGRRKACHLDRLEAGPEGRTPPPAGGRSARVSGPGGGYSASAPTPPSSASGRGKEGGAPHPGSPSAIRPSPSRGGCARRGAA